MIVAHFAQLLEGVLRSCPNVLLNEVDPPLSHHKALHFPPPVLLPLLMLLRLRHWLAFVSGGFRRLLLVAHLLDGNDHFYAEVAS